MSKRTEPPCNNLELVARMVFGARWHVELAEAMSVTTRTVRRWQDDPSLIDAIELKNAFRDHRSKCSEAITMLRDGLDLTGVPDAPVIQAEAVDTPPEAIVVEQAPEVAPPADVEPVVEASVVRVRQIATIADVPSWLLSAEEIPVAIAEMQAAFDKQFEEGTARTRHGPAVPEPVGAIKTSHGSLTAIVDAQARSCMSDERWAQHMANRERREAMERLGHDDLRTGDRIRVKHGKSSREAHVVSRDLAGTVTVMERLIHSGEWQAPRTMRAEDFERVIERDAPQPEINRDMERLREKARQRILDRLGDDDLLPGDVIRIQAANPHRRLTARVTRRDGGKVYIECESLRSLSRWGKETRLMPGRLRRVLDRVGLDETVDAALAAEAA